MITRRAMFKGSLAIAALTGLSSISACSSSKGTSSLQLWRWPPGFSKPAFARLEKKFPNYHIQQNVIGGDFKQKLSSVFNAHTGLPHITGIKGEDIAFFRAKPDHFEDLNKLGFDKLAKNYLPWKIKQAKATDGRQIGFPMDIGPTVLYYREDIFAKAGLPNDPQKLAERVKTWDDFFKLAQDLLKAAPGHFMINDAASVFGMSLSQQKNSFIDENGSFIGADTHIKKCWDYAVKAVKLGLSASVTGSTPDMQSMLNDGTMSADTGASWHLGDIKEQAPKTSGKWRITTCPGGSANIGGSFLAIPKGAGKTKEAFEVIAYAMDAEGQTIEYKEKGNFPSALAAMESKVLQEPVKFLGGQKAIDILGPAAKEVVAQYQDPNDDAVGAAYYKEITSVEKEKKDPNKAWEDALQAAKQKAKQLGVKGV